VATLLSSQTVAEAIETLQADSTYRLQHLYPVLDDEGAMMGAIGYSGLLEASQDGRGSTKVSDIAVTELVTASPDETLRSAAETMAEKWLGVLPVVDHNGHLVGMLTQFDLLKARHRQLVEERVRERVLTLWSGPGASKDRTARVRQPGMLGAIERRIPSVHRGPKLPVPLPEGPEGSASSGPAPSRGAEPAPDPEAEPVQAPEGTLEPTPEETST
ncbi:MAG: CBS domain-containing protein, partial [Acidimicrobiales bacterium]